MANGDEIKGTAFPCSVQIHVFTVLKVQCKIIVEYLV